MTIPNRVTTFNALFNLIQGSKTIVETGTIRNHLDKYKYGDGHSTLRFAEYIWGHGGELYSVDIDPMAVLVSKSLVGKEFPQAMEHIHIIESDSVAFLESFDEPIDVLYLDSANDAELILNEAKAALCNLHEESIVLIDDCFNENEYHIEKGALAIPFLEENGWIMEVSEYQALFIHKDRF
ncbi:MAG: class I SAM-dependent methyltransferase [Euryarchaeota archaeon]|jgi:hypothetical protein|nr:class I SAM-dependent methyltransferase [Euryarchaeota archaeon]